jgi:hypothetical protein
MVNEPDEIANAAFDCETQARFAPRDGSACVFAQLFPAGNVCQVVSVYIYPAKSQSEFSKICK